MWEIKEPDWKLLRRVHPLALERFCERVLAEVDRVSHDGATSHARYLEIFRGQSEAKIGEPSRIPEVQAVGCEVDFAPPME